MSDDAGGTSIRLFGVYTAARIVGFLGLVYFTKVLSQSELGVYFLFFLVVQVSSLVSNLGLQQALVTKIGEGERPDAAFSAALAVVSAASLVVAAVVFLFRTPLANYVGADVPFVISVATAAWLLSDIHKNGLQAEDRVLASGLLQLAEDVIRVAVGAVLVSVDFGSFGLMLGVVAGFLGTALIGNLATDLSIVRPRRHDFRRIFSVSRYTMVYGPTNFLYFWLDTFAIGFFIGQAAVSSYEVAWQTTRVLIIATTAISTTIFPKIPRWAEAGEYGEIERVIPGTVLFTLVFPIPGLAGLLVLGPDVLRLVYTPAYVEAAVPMVLLAGYMVVEAVQRVSNPILTGIERADVPFRTRLLGVAVAVALNLVLIPRYGLLGAAVATLVAKALDTVVQWVAMVRLLDVRLPLRSLGWELCSAAAMGAVVAGAARVVAPDSLPRLFALVALGAAVYGVLVIQDPEIRGVVQEYSPVRLPV